MSTDAQRRRLAFESTFILLLTFAAGFNVGVLFMGSR